ncbi:hypothetical protein [Natronorarus salvus]|uniref:hypothetical protein n=1 Tax=Natronorarus salvus TaxID=3117733 RepID=UPI002F2657C4
MDDEECRVDETRRRTLRGIGATVGGLALTNGLSPASARSGGPVLIGPDGEVRPEDVEAAIRTDGGNRVENGEADARYLELIREATELRANSESTMDSDAIRAVLRERNEGFRSDLVFFAASDFGSPQVFVPEGFEERDERLNAVLDRIHEQKWRADSQPLRSVRDEVFERVPGIHQGLAALCHADGTADYDIVYGWHGVYNFYTIRQVVGLVDWVTNADDRWREHLHFEY